MVEVKKIAEKIREAFERWEYDTYGKNGNMCGYCKRASIMLFTEARKKGYKVQLVACFGHVYNLYDGHIIDITATQFGIKDKVWITKSEGAQIGNWQPMEKGNNLSSIEELSEIGWKTTQREIEIDYQCVIQKYLGNDYMEKESCCDV